MNRLLVICGPTATGKTALAAALAKQFNGELVSADSRQVYRGMDLVTGKDRPDVPSWLYDVANPDEEFSVSQWVKLARAAIADIQKRNKLPIVVGGTGLYINALIHPFETIDIPPNKALRARLHTLSVAELQKMVKRSGMNDSDWQNSRRLIRKIEIAEFKTATHKQTNTFDYFVIGITAQLPTLDKRIDERLGQRLRQGMKEETEKLLKKYNGEFPSMSAIGLNEHAYARRQMTWFKKQKGIHWFDVTDPEYGEKVAALVAAWYTCS
ncbi:MAG: tRNA (adenosine(37)-N6)-dimethylallyltransferase MiaA [Candidatus Gottesmanbacteria bacterium]|nr:tRNA (adenosine(37)-N6)-dimethylallyltransferase MiaA [Candidatus Gottesmanbacteria bacterium]